MIRFSKKQTTLESVRDKEPKPLSGVRRFFSSRKAKYGAVAAVFTAVVLIVALLFNVILTMISEKSPLAIDFSASDFFTLSDASRALVAGAMGEAKETVRIRFMMPEDQLNENETYHMMLRCAKSYREAFDNIELDFLDIVTRPSDVSEYRTLGFSIDSRSVIVDCPAKGRVKMFGAETCFLKREGETKYYGFDGETQFTAALMAVCREEAPVVTFTQGHGETVPVQLEKMFVTAGYTVKRANLAKEEMDPATQILVISDPQTDFLGLFAGKNNEIDVITEYLNDFKDAMVFLSPATQPLPELDALLKEWGVVVERGVALRDDTSSIAASGGAMLIADYAGEAYLTDGSYSTFGSALHKQLTEQESAPMTLVPSAAPVTQLFSNTDGEDGQRSVDTVLQTSENAYLTAADGSREVGTYPLMVLSTVAGYRDDDTAYSHLLVCGSSGFSEVVAAGDSTYGNSEILYTAMTLMGKETAPQGIALKKLDDTALSAPEGYAQTCLILSLTVLPGIVFILGAVVYFKRRHK